MPDNTTRTEGVFGFQRHAFGAGSIEYGLRFDRQRIGGIPERLRREGAQPVARRRARSRRSSRAGRTATRSERHPSATELYADGPHVATQQFEVGDPDLDTERGITRTRPALRRRQPGRRGTRIRIPLPRLHRPVGDRRRGGRVAGLPVSAADSLFKRLEAELANTPPAPAFTLELTGEYLRGRLKRRQPPAHAAARLGARLRFDEAAWSASLALNHHFEQDQVAALELPTDAYTMLDADLVFRPDRFGESVVLFLRGRNLLDEDARLHTSPLKNQLPCLAARSRGRARGVRAMNARTSWAATSPPRVPARRTSARRPEAGSVSHRGGRRMPA